MSRIYTHPTEPKVDVPKLDLLSLLFDSDLTPAQDDTVLHVEAANPSNQITKAQLRDLTERIAHGLRFNYGIGKDGPNKDVVTVMSYGQILVPAALFGVIAAGGVYSAASPSSTVSELARQINMGSSNLIICSIEHKDVVTRAAAQCNVPSDRILILESSPSWQLSSLNGNVNVISSQRLPWTKISDYKALKESLVVVLWSSGTTGLPKGVMLSHLNFVAESWVVTLSGRRWAEQEVAKGTYQPTPFRSLAHLPISHIAGLCSYSMLAHFVGGTMYWMRKYNWPDLLKYAREYKITSFYTVPSIYLRISKSSDVTDQFSWLESASTGAAPMDNKLQQASNRKLGKGKDPLIGQTWGLSETTGAVTAIPKGEADDTGCIGYILPGVELRMVDEEYRDVEPGQEGELLIRSDLVMNGYYNNPEATKDAFHGDWFCSGDIGVMRNGKFYVVDRKKELLKYKGLQVAPAEIEGLLFRHPKIKEAAVVGVPDPSAGDLPRAYVTPADGCSISEDEVKQYVADNLAAHKQLRGGVAFIDEIPRNAIGKFLRRDLRERAKKEMATRAKL